MSARRAKKARRNTSSASERAQRPATAAKPHDAAPAMSPLAAGGALLLLATCVVPIALWGNPYPDEVLRYWVVGGICVVIAAVIAATLAPDLPRALDAFAARLSPAMFATVVATVTFALSLFFAIFVFRRGASTSDELASLWHARILLSGHLSLPVDPNREFFSLDNVVDTGRWYSQFPIGGPLFVALGAAVGAPWLVNPVLAGASAALLYHFARRAFGESQGRAAAALFSVAPMVLMIAGTWLNHVPALFLATCALAALVEWTEASSFRVGVAFAALIGAAVGGIATIRPLDAIVVAVVVGVFQLDVIRRTPLRARELLAQGLCGVLAVAPLLYANWSTTGNALTFGYDMSWGAGHRVGFHTDPYGNPHTLSQALEYAVTYVSELNINLMAWPVPALSVAFAGLLLTRRATRWDALVLGLFWAQVLAYAAYWGEGQFLGPRFLFTALPATIILIARMPFVISDRFGGRGRPAAAALILACVAVAWLVPIATYGVWGLATQARGSRRILKIDIPAAVRSAGVHNAVVFLREPFGARLARRMWGTGVLRSDAAQLLATRDACSLLSAVQAAEAGNHATPAATSAWIARTAMLFVSGKDAVQTTDATIHVSSPTSITPGCQTELDIDRLPAGAPFGPALPFEPIGPGGRLDGDVIYAADLGEHNEVLRPRFGNRTWYRVALVRTADGAITSAVIRPY